jgi:hypothetical protein
MQNTAAEAGILVEHDQVDVIAHAQGGQQIERGIEEIQNIDGAQRPALRLDERPEITQIVGGWGGHEQRCTKYDVQSTIDDRRRR